MSTYKNTETVWLYDILLNHVIVGTQGEFEFSSQEDAEKDAKAFITGTLMKEYNRQESDFLIKYYEVAN
jgi:hypothetical protein